MDDHAYGIGSTTVVQYFSSISAASRATSPGVARTGATDMSLDGTPHSSKNRSKPPGMNTAMSRPLVGPTFLYVWTTPRGVQTTDPAVARVGGLSPCQ